LCGENVSEPPARPAGFVQVATSASSEAFFSAASVAAAWDGDFLSFAGPSFEKSVASTIQSGPGLSPLPTNVPQPCALSSADISARPVGVPLSSISSISAGIVT
jgi:hypothetical protein